MTWIQGRPAVPVVVIADIHCLVCHDTSDLQQDIARDVSKIQYRTAGIFADHCKVGRMNRLHGATIRLLHAQSQRSLECYQSQTLVMTSFTHLME